MNHYIARVEKAIEELKKGKMIILTDDADRENEGDLIFPAENTTPEMISFMLRHTSGIICLSLQEELIRCLDIPLMLAPHENNSQRHTPFTVSIEAKEGITTGVSAADRATTILAAVKDGATKDDIVKPGHIFPLQAQENGVLTRAGHTEGSIDLVKLAGFKPAAVLCEVMNPDGSMARGDALQQFADEHQIMMVAIADLIAYRRAYENLIQEEATAVLPLQEYGSFAMTVFREKTTQQEHFTLYKKPVATDKPMLVRIHSACMTGDLFASKRCDCHQQLHHSLQRLSEEGGMLIYLNQEGRGVGLLNKIKAYALQEQGMDTVEANQHLDLPVDSRDYYLAANILRNHAVQSVRLLTNNPAKISGLQAYGIANVIREALPLFSNEHNQAYLATKKNKLQHIFNEAV